MGCCVEFKAAVRAAHESTVMSCFSGFLSAVSARCHHWRCVWVQITQSTNEPFNTWALIPMHCSPVLAHSLHHWPERGHTEPWHLVSQPAYSLLILIHLYILSSRAVGPKKSKNLHRNFLTAGAHQVSVWTEESKTCSLVKREKHWTSSCCFTLRILKISVEEGWRGWADSGWKYNDKKIPVMKWNSLVFPGCMGQR